MNTSTVEKILGSIETPESETEMIELIKKHLSVDNNKLREDFICGLLGYETSFGGAGYPDGYTLEGVSIDCKSGPNIIFPDGHKSIFKKLDWMIVVSEYTAQGELIYVVELPMLDIIDELLEDVVKKTHKLKSNSPSRISPTVTPKVWLKKENTVVRYKNLELFRRNKNDKLNKFYTQLDTINYQPVL